MPPSPPDTPLAAVLADPADDLARLVYADWLDDRGDPAWAAAIRVMCGLPHEFDAEVQVERMGTGRPSPDVAAALGWLESHAPYHLSVTLGGRRCDRVPGDWPWVTGCPALGLTAEWRRGFVADLKGPLDAVREHLPRLVAEHPVEWALPSDGHTVPVYPGRRFDPVRWGWDHRTLAALGNPLLLQASQPTEAAAREALSDFLLRQARAART